MTTPTAAAAVALAVGRYYFSALERAASAPTSACGGRRKEPSRGFFVCIPVLVPFLPSYELQLLVEVFIHRYGSLHAPRATGLTGTESGESLDLTESVARCSRVRRPT